MTPETLAALVERCATYERRGLMLYRRLAERFASDPGAAAVWHALSNAEASHFTTLQLAGDWLTMAGAAATPAPAGGVPAATAVDAALTGFETAAAAASLGVADAVRLTVEWEEQELPRVFALVAALPSPVRERVRAGLLAGMGSHHDDLRRLLAAVNDAGALSARVTALAAMNLDG